ncbi:MAG: DUF4159 domain-containing protein [Candidatus Delongbacteria bacterium]|nr:DUF4159 domain-containing protein [Candidatus Delongbacteria bacterium]
MTKYRLIAILLLVLSGFGKDFFIGRLKYDGGGDWYSNPSSINNLLQFISKETGIDCAAMENIVTANDNLSSFPYIYLTGHGTIDMTESEIELLRKHLLKGGFLHADDNYGLNDSFRRLVKKMFPDKQFVTVPFDHPIYNIKYKFPDGLPKIHEHDGKNPEGLGIFHNGRLILFYSYETDLGDGWEDKEVHNDPEEKRLLALRMGCNLVLYYLESFK